MRTQRVNSAGFTLLELMITLAIGATLTTTGLSLYQQTTQNRNLIQSELALQESSYFLHQTLRQYVNKAGYRPLSTSSANSSILPVRVSRDVFPEVEGSWQAGRFIKLLNSGLAFRFEGASAADGSADGSMVNCQGESIAAGDIAELQFTVNNGLLVCTSNGADVELIGLADDVRVEQLIVQLGVDQNNDRNVDVFLQPSDVLASTDTLVSVRLAILLASLNEVQNYSDSYIFNGVEVTATDKKIRHQSVTTIQLKH